MRTILKYELQARSRVPETETLDNMVRQLTDELNVEIEEMDLIQGDPDLQELRKQNKYARNNYIDFDNVKNVKFKQIITKHEDTWSRVQEIKTPNLSKAAKSRVQNRQLSKSRVMKRKSFPIVFENI